MSLTVAIHFTDDRWNNCHSRSDKVAGMLEVLYFKENKNLTKKLSPSDNCDNEWDVESSNGWPGWVSTQNLNSHLLWWLYFNSELYKFKTLIKLLINILLKFISTIHYQIYWKLTFLTNHFNVCHPLQLWRNWNPQCRITLACWWLSSR